MSSDSGGTKKPDRVESAGGAENMQGQGRRNRNRNRTPRSGEPFIGKVEDLKGVIYDVVAGKETFTETTKQIALYVSREFPDAGEYRVGMVELRLEELVRPEPPADRNDPVALELWKDEKDAVRKKMEKRERASGQVFSTVMDQCSPALINRLEAHTDWTRIHREGDVIELLKLIRSSMTLGQTRQYDYHSWVTVEGKLRECKQTKYMSNHEYYEKFKECVANAERLGTEVGYSERRVQQELDESAADGGNPTEEELSAAKKKVKESFLAVMFLVNSDQRRYGELLRNIENDYTLGTQKYPSTLSAAYDCLMNYKVVPIERGRDEGGGLAFYNNGQEGRGGRAGRGQGGRDSNGGRGRGRGRGGGRGDGDTNNSSGGKVSENGDEEADHSQYLLDQADNNNDEVAAYTIDYVDRLETCLQVLGHNGMQAETLLLDSCSTVCLISNGRLLHDIHDVDQPMRVRCNAGVRATSKMGYLGSFPEPVWYDPGGIANILSLFVVQKYYHVTFDSSKDNSFKVHLANASLCFQPTAKGLYAMDKNASDKYDWAMVTTVQQKMSGYSARAYNAAVRARTIQNIMMYPSDRQLEEIVDHNLIKNLDVTRSDIQAANDIFGPNVGSLYGKTVRKASPRVQSMANGIPADIQSKCKNIVLGIDILFVNKVPFFITTSRDLHFGTVEDLNNRQIPTVSAALEQVVKLYERRGLKVVTINADREFAPLETDFPKVTFNFASADEHVPEIERYIRTVKDRVRSRYNTLPFTRIPRLMLVRLVANAVFWLNAFPHKDGVSTTLSPRYLLTGQHLDASKHVRCEFGSYVQTHEKHTSDMQPRTTGAICLGPTGNEQGGHYFLSLSTGERLHRQYWTPMTMPNDVIARVSQLGAKQKMPKTLTFANRFGLELPDYPDDADDDHDSSYSPSDDDDSSVDTSFSHDSDSDPDDPLVGPPALAGVSPAHRIDNRNVEPFNDGMDHPNDVPHDAENNSIGSTGPGDDESNSVGSDTHEDSVETTGVEDSVENAGVGDYVENAGVEEMEDTPSESDQIAAEMDTRYGPRNHGINLRPRKPRSYDHLHAYLADQDPVLLQECVQSVMDSLFMTEQLPLNRGLKLFGKDGADSVVNELRQLDRMDAIIPRDRKSLSREQLKRALRYLMYLKQKRCGRIKARGCADGRPQRLYKSKEETSSPTVVTESVFLTALVAALERRKSMTLDIPGAFMHSKMDELIHMKLEGPMAELLARVNPGKYRKYIVTENGRPVVYVELAKALYGTLQAAFLFYKNISSFLVDELGFTINPYDSCVANKTIDGKQCTICWHVDDLMITHVDQKVLDDIAEKFNNKYGSPEAPVTATRGEVHDYLGMTLDFSEDGKVQFRMDDYVENLLNEAPSDFEGTSVTPATANLFTVNDQAEKLPPEKAELFHRFTAKLLYLCKRVRIDIQTAVAFLTTRVKQPDVDDWKKLARCIRYLRADPKLPLTLEMADCCKIEWWIDASFAVHRDMRSHTGLTMSLGKGG
ncbi:hypothetical protein FisN_4Lu403 [Fistulifera solaris]|uniref:Reverse transcriptase Ty1/copia-type domain-containing protein n=1 Tax=Fistulifera solaris TaxID=1519565 RepID=A0A1Z5K0A3_FISSO|nr:hypothetical protein FisN_4Lu403 [Fistulifera solaris]|eukprot:GAX19421.1 hypothetical protein FisN_4Lu403 [Fistulifera solaris]